MVLLKLVIIVSKSVPEGFKMLAQGVLLLSANKYMSATIPFCLVVVFFIQRIYLETSRQLRTMDLEYRSPVYSQFLETVRFTFTIALKANSRIARRTFYNTGFWLSKTIRGDQYGETRYLSAALLHHVLPPAMVSHEFNALNISSLDIFLVFSNLHPKF